MSAALDEVRRMKVGQTYRNVQITGELKDFERRLYEGDATVGWIGKDDTLTLRIAFPVDAKGNPTRGDARYEIWGCDRQGNQYVCASGPRADAQLLRQLANNDTRTGASSFEGFWAEVAKNEAAQEKANDEKLAAGYDRLHFSLLKDLGHMSGQRHRLYTPGTFKKDDAA